MARVHLSGHRMEARARTRGVRKAGRGHAACGRQGVDTLCSTLSGGLVYPSGVFNRTLEMSLTTKHWGLKKSLVTQGCLFPGALGY